ncbi:hypothetical protein NHH03_27735, partial [Stieleria sp. TO1_6]|uniref:beta strand repeat-containing protein n=1 Tax=Stieleria tagensis TaxID=2956795 RepID=UPI00209B6BB0
IDIDYSDGDLVDINDNHQINSVVHNNSDRLLDYTATLGDISVNSITSGNAAVTLTAAAGAIAEAATNTSTNISTAGVLTLSAATGIGADGADQALDTNVGTLAAQTTLSGGIYINQTGDLLVGVGDNGIDGITAATGGSVGLESSGNVSLNSGSRVIAGGNGTSLAIDAGSINLNPGTAGTETIQNTGSGSIELTADAGDITLDHHSIGTGSGTVTVDAGTGDILVAQSVGTSEINSTGTVTLSGAAIGSTNALEIDGATALEIFDNGTGAIQIAELSADTITSTAITVGNVGFGTIDIVYNNDDLVDIDDSHEINSVVHNNANRDFEYTATSGDVRVNEVFGGSAAVTLTSLSGSIDETVSDTSINVTTDGTLTLSASTGIGSS